MSNIATPEMIAAAWDAWKSRPGWKLGPGPAFREAIEAALSVRSKEPELEHHVLAGLAARLAKAERERDDLRHDVERHIAAASSEAARAEAAEARLARMREALEEAEKVIATCAEYAAKYNTPEYDQFDWAAIAAGHLRAARKWMESRHD
jgi:sirohydrochlorin ferrochelatase